ncbi:Transposon Tf2-8 polyprotein [Vitis vinifera]|uniref:Transposon Tf2-8 polyprotein n=1 Tax=Vitis vinifera TaxID=29760 RepID=A0A438IJJ9_VITVI|nr:Transposon Tf2-8 polyprotein [Vitis vinifera]
MAARSSAMDAIREQITRLEAYVGDSLDGDTTLSARVAETVEELGVQRGLAENRDKYVEIMESLATMIKTAVEQFRGRVGSLEGGIALLKQAVLQGTPSISKPTPTKMLNFGGKREPVMMLYLGDVEEGIEGLVPSHEQGVGGSGVSEETKANGLEVKFSFHYDPEREEPTATTSKGLPKKEKLNALIAAEEDNSESGTPTRMNPLQLLNAIRAETHRGLMYVEMAMGGQKVVASVDSGTTHNFVSTREATRLGLKLSKDDSKLKAVNSQTQETHGLAKNMMRAKVALLPHLNGIFIMDETQPCYMRGLSKPPKKPSKEETVSALQVEKGLRKEQLTYVAALIEIKPEKMVEVPNEIVPILQETDPTFKGTVWGTGTLIPLAIDLFDRLTNAPATFCNLMNDVLFDFLDSFVVVYLDDIVIYSQTLQDHLVHLEKALGVQGTNMHGWIQGGSNPGLAYTYKVLRLPDLELPFEVQTDASDKALRGVLVQEGHLVAFESRKLGRHNQVADALSRKKVTEFVGSLSQVVADFSARVRQEAPQDSIYNKLVDQVKEDTTRRYWLDDGLLYHVGRKLYVPSRKLRREFLKETHDTKEEEGTKFVASSAFPERPWRCLSMDFITRFLKVQGYWSILVVVDTFSKYVVFIPVQHECPVEEAARLFFSNVVKYFGIPEDIVSDRDSRFIDKFWVELFKMMGTECKFSTTNYPQMDGQAERVNALLKEYLRHYVSATQQNWLELMDVAQLSYNLHQSSVTGKSPFEVVIGFQPRMPMDVLANY